MRYLGLSLGMAVALGLTTVIGPLGPPIFHGTFVDVVAMTGGKVTFIGIALTLIGVVIGANAGHAKATELGGTGANTGVAEFNLKKGIWYFQFFFYTMGEGQIRGTAASRAGRCTWPPSSCFPRCGASR